MSFPPCDLRDQQIDDFFKRIQEFSPDVVFDEKKSDEGYIRLRQVTFDNPKEGISIDIKVIQVTHSRILISPLFIINADYGDVE